MTLRREKRILKRDKMEEGKAASMRIHDTVRWRLSQSCHPPHLTLLGPDLPFASMPNIYKYCYSRCLFQGTPCQSRLQSASWSPTRRDERKQKKAKKGIEGVLLAWHTLQNKPFLWLAELLAGLTNISSYIAYHHDVCAYNIIWWDGWCCTYLRIGFKEIELGEYLSH